MLDSSGENVFRCLKSAFVRLHSKHSERFLLKVNVVFGFCDNTLNYDATGLITKAIWKYGNLADCLDSNFYFFADSLKTGQLIHCFSVHTSSEKGQI